MKRRIPGIVLASALMLSAAAPAAQAAPSEETLAAAYKAYYDVLKTATDEYGIGFTSDLSEEDWEDARENGVELQPSSSGLIYAELIDFETGGLPQLLVFYGSYGLGFYNMSCDVYDFTVSGAELCGTYTAYGTTYAAEFEGEYGYSGVYLSEDRDGASFLRVAVFDGSGAVSSENLYTIKDGIWIEVPGDGFDFVNSRELTVELNPTSVNAVLEELQSLPPAAPPEPSPQAPEALDALPSAWSLNVDGGDLRGTDMYNINGSNYLKIRDIAALLDGTEKQFNITVEGRTVNMIPDAGYEARGDEMTRNPDAVSTKTSESTFDFTLDGERVELTSYMIAGSNYIRIRDVLRLFDVYVDYDAGLREFYIDTERAYEDN
ncbi:MAG: hypothetical protein FWG32_08180 [Oscillospiraceae bacterium]|nr:hypothetical protein [Oscillospiraceae bacterium]